MAAPGDNTAPVIIKRKKVVKADGHHGGAWKVAYADFVTAMMAFFLLMWLLGATTEEQRKGIADYFSPVVLADSESAGGQSTLGGDSIFSENTNSKNGTGASNKHPTEAWQARGENGVSVKGADTVRAEDAARSESDAKFSRVEEKLLGRAGESTISDGLYRHVRARVTDAGLIIELFDLDESRLFAPDTPDATPLLEDLVMLVASAAGLVENGIAVEGYTRARPVVLADSPVWDLSAARANAVRLLLEGRGIATARLRRITGHADRKPAVRNPLEMRNNRIEVILLRSPP